MVLFSFTSCQNQEDPTRTIDPICGEDSKCTPALAHLRLNFNIGRIMNDNFRVTIDDRTIVDTCRNFDRNRIGIHRSYGKIIVEVKNFGIPNKDGAEIALQDRGFSCHNYFDVIHSYDVEFKFKRDRSGFPYYESTLSEYK